MSAKGSASSRWPVSGPACPGSPSGGGVLEWAAGGGAEPADPVPPCPCRHQVSAAGQIALSPQAVEDWMLAKLFFSGRAPCSVAHVQL